MATLLNPFLRALDANADSVSGGLLYVFEAGTTTPVTTYSDSAMTTAQSQPLVANAAGEFAGVFVPSGTYKIRVADSGAVVLYEVDDIRMADRPDDLPALDDEAAVAADTTSYADGSVIFAIGEATYFEVAPSGATAYDLTNAAGEKLRYKNRNYTTVAALLASAEQSRGEGAIWQAQGFLYEDVASGHHLTTAGGVKLKVLPLDDGGVCVQQFGETGTSDDNIVFGRFIAYLNANGTTGHLGQGTVTFSTTQSLTRGGASIVGGLGGSQRTGSTKLQSTLEWVGGTAPMFDTDTTAHSFQGFGVEGNGSATDFLEMNSGAQRVFMTDIFFDTLQFSRSVIRSNGNRIGYSKFHRVNAIRPAPKFIDVDGDGTANSCTPVQFSECSFSNTGAGGASPWTVLHLKDETIEAVTFDRCLFISRDGTIVVDTTDTPVANTINVLALTNCEIDNVEGTSFRMFKLENVNNVLLRGNVIAGNGTSEYLFDCVSTKICDVTGNHWASIGYLFDLDDDCQITGVGRNFMDWSKTTGIHDNPVATYISVTQSAAVLIDASNFAPNEIGLVICDITTSAGYGFRVDAVKPESIEPGQRFDIMVRNVSGGAISQSVFHSGTFKAPNGPAPADGYSRTYSFRWDGSYAVEVGRIVTDVPN